MLQKQNLIKALGFLGLIPFILYFPLNYIHFDTKILNLQKIITLYSSMILAFVCGSHWGLVISKNVKGGEYILLLSNMLVVVAWGVSIFNSFKLFCLTAATIFFFSWLIDAFIFKRTEIPRYYLQLRKYISVSAAILLAIMAYL